VIVRCGACRNQFDVQGPGRYACPTCGSVNVVRSAGGAAGAAPGAAPQDQGLASAAHPPMPPDPPSPRISCPECAFSFIVGNIPVVTCPNCGAEVETGKGAETA
jgi:DNA-directed RNA polymerase subunit RPC12/RpoP